MPHRLHRLAIIAAILFSLTISCAYCYDDGFGQVRKVESKHFAVYYAPSLDVFSLAESLNIGPADKVMAGGASANTFSSEEEGLADMIDTLFMRVCDILDMQLYSFQGNIKICKDFEQLNRIYNNLFDKELQGTRSFYVYTLNTIYISPESFKREILGHEIAHAIISHYFVVQTPVKIQEVLASYVEYQLRKTTH